MKRIVFLSLFSALLSLFVSSVGAVEQKLTLEIQNRNESDFLVAYGYVVGPEDVNSGNEKLAIEGFHVRGWTRVPSRRIVRIDIPMTSYDYLYVGGKLLNGMTYSPGGKTQKFRVHPEKDFKVVYTLNGIFHHAFADVNNNGIYYRVDKENMNHQMIFNTYRVKTKHLVEIPGNLPLNFDGDYDMRGFSRQGTDYALLFATDQYEHWDNLRTPIADAEAIGAVLHNQYGFKVDIRRNVTKKEILAALDEYKAKRYDPGDQLFVYFAGHGEFDEGLEDGHVAGTESELPGGDRNLSTYISFNKLRVDLENFPCKRIMLMLDVCYGGTFDEKIALGKKSTETPFKPRDRGAEPLNLMKMKPEETLAVKTRWYLSSGGNEMVSDGAGGHSPFALALLTLLKDSGNRDGVLTVPEIERQLPSTLEDELERVRGIYKGHKVEQTPVSGPFGSSKVEKKEGDKVFLFIGRGLTPN